MENKEVCYVIPKYLGFSVLLLIPNLLLLFVREYNPL